MILFGKLPRHGDFVARGLDAAAHAAWDRWAAGGLAAAREALGEAFDAAHGSAPAWRFVDGPGVLGSAWRAGAVAPSIDSVGRSFVIALAADGLSAGQAAAGGEHMAERCEDLIYRSLQEGLSADEAVAAGESVLSGLVEGEGAPSARWWTLGAGPAFPPAWETAGATPEALFRRMLAPAEAAT